METVLRVIQLLMALEAVILIPFIAYNLYIARKVIVRMEKEMDSVALPSTLPPADQKWKR